MITALFRSRANRRVLDDVHGRLTAAARQPALFLPPYAVPDTVSGRFDLLVLFAILLVRRLEGLPDPAPEMAQDIVDRLFQHFDAGLREMGVGDLTVPKRIKTMAEAYGGRSASYRAALDGNDAAAFAAALARNIYGVEAPDARARALAHYAARAVDGLEREDFASLTRMPNLFPDPEAIDGRL